MAGKVKIATVSMAAGLRSVKNRQDNLDYIQEQVREAAAVKPDIIALPELFPVACLDEGAKLIASDKDRELMLSLAKEYQVCLVGSILEERKGKLYNTALFVDKRGKVIGRYDKTHPTEGEMDKGVTPGKKEQLPVDTEFGKIGAQICFDANWPQGWEDLAAKGAEIIFFPSAFPGGRILEAIALLNQVYIVTSIWTVDSGIIDNTGRWVVKTDPHSWCVWATIDRERMVFHWDFQFEKPKEIRKKYGDSIKIESFAAEARFALEANTEDVSVPDIAREFGLVTYQDYIKRDTQAQDKARA